MLKLLVLVISMTVSSLVQAYVPITLCYEDKHIPPLFTGVGAHVPPENPGASVEILQDIDSLLPQVAIFFVRKPWQRCLHELKKNKVDAVIASYRQDREAFMAFPKLENGELNHGVAMSRFGTCLTKKPNDTKPMLHTANTMQSLTIAVPRGYSVEKRLMQTNHALVQTDSVDDAYELIKKGVVDATIGLCQIGNTQVKAFPHADKLEVIVPPIDVSLGFLAFSKQFYTEQKEVSEAVWQTISTMELDNYYLEYLEQ